MNIISGKQVVTTAGTPQAMASAPSDTTMCKKLIITPFSANTGVVAIGGSAATTVANATIGSQQGAVMVKAANPITLEDVYLSQVWIDASVSGEGVSYVAEY